MVTKLGKDSTTWATFLICTKGTMQQPIPKSVAIYLLYNPNVNIEPVRLNPDFGSYQRPILNFAPRGKL
jgi:hypothetical protein